ncbi:hypothetical protein TWF481_009871 [Arthrobotrys musiformis]|uniref:Uncharacterized protein n=1 Tax=Arthrobotrys musiformis TaxID=47236 RepID=A0AAV9W668_9PEZI
MRQQIVCKNWPCATPSWIEVLLDLVQHYLCLLLLILADIMGKPLHDLDSLWEKVVKVAFPFTIIWGLACWGDTWNRRATIRVLSCITPHIREALEPVSAVVGALVSIAAMPFRTRCVRQSRPRVATQTTIDDAVRAFELSTLKWIVNLLGLAYHCALMAGCLVVIAFCAVVVHVPNPFQIHVGFRRWRARAAQDVWCWFFPLPPVERSVIPLIRRRDQRTFDEESQKVLDEGHFYLVFPRPGCPGPIFAPQVPDTSHSPLPRTPSPTPDYSHMFAHPPPPPPPAARPAEGTVPGPLPKKYKDRKKSKYFQAPRWSPIPLL